MRTVRPFAYAVALSLLALSPRAALAQGDGAKDKEVARALAERGFELFEQGEAEKAIVSFRMAERRIHSPVHQLFIARAQTKLGRFVEALAVYEEIAREKVPAGSPKPFFEAQNDARSELESLRSRTPSIKIDIIGVSPAGAKVTIDGKPVKTEALGVPQRIDPGKHTIVASADGGSPVEKTLTLAEGSYVQTLQLTLQSGGVSVPAVIAFSLGGAGLIAGTATGVVYLGKTDPSPTLGVLSLVGFITGGVGIVTGTLLVTLGGPSDPGSPSAASRPTLRASVGLGSLSVGGTF